MKTGHCHHCPRPNLQKIQPIPHSCICFCPEMSTGDRRRPGSVAFMEIPKSTLNSFYKATHSFHHHPPTDQESKLGSKLFHSKDTFRSNAFPELTGYYMHINTPSMFSLLFVRWPSSQGDAPAKEHCSQEIHLMRDTWAQKYRTQISYHIKATSDKRFTSQENLTPNPRFHHPRDLPESNLHSSSHPTLVLSPLTSYFLFWNIHPAS